MVAKEFWLMVFYDMLFCSLLCARLVKCMRNLNGRCACVASATPQPRIRKKFPKTQRKGDIVEIFFHEMEIIQPSL